MGGLTTGQGGSCGCTKCGQMKRMVAHAQKKTGLKSVALPSASGLVMKPPGKAGKRKTKGSIYK